MVLELTRWSMTWIVAVDFALHYACRANPTFVIELFSVAVFSARLTFLVGLRLRTVCCPSPATRAVVLSPKLTVHQIQARLRPRIVEPGEALHCGVCKLPLAAGETTIGLRCRHCFHDACLRQWLLVRNKCPACAATAISFSPVTPASARRRTTGVWLELELPPRMQTLPVESPIQI